MSGSNEKPDSYLEQFFYGAVTVGERGQIVIPAKARRDYGIENGDQLLIMGHPSKHGLMVTKLDGIRAFLTQMLDDLKFIESQQTGTLTAAAAPTLLPSPQAGTKDEAASGKNHPEKD